MVDRQFLGGTVMNAEERERRKILKTAHLWKHKGVMGAAWFRACTGSTYPKTRAAINDPTGAPARVDLAGLANNWRVSGPYDVGPTTYASFVMPLCFSERAMLSKLYISPKGPRIKLQREGNRAIVVGLGFKCFYWRFSRWKKAKLRQRKDAKSCLELISSSSIAPVYIVRN